MRIFLWNEVSNAQRNSAVWGQQIACIRTLSYLFACFRQLTQTLTRLNFSVALFRFVSGCHVRKTHRASPICRACHSLFVLATSSLISGNLVRFVWVPAIGTDRDVDDWKVKSRHDHLVGFLLIFVQRSTWTWPVVFINRRWQLSQRSQRPQMVDVKTTLSSMLLTTKAHIERRFVVAIVSCKTHTFVNVFLANSTTLYTESTLGMCFSDWLFWQCLPMPRPFTKSQFCCIFLGETEMRFALLVWASFRSFVRTSRNQPLEYLENGLT